MIAFLSLAVGAILGFLLPGLALATLLRSRVPLAASFILSSVILFQVVFWCGVCSVTLSYANVASVLAVLTGILSYFALRNTGNLFRGCLNERFTFSRKQWPVVILSAVGLLMFVRAFMQPLSGYDMPFRWNFLALRMLETGAFSYYPPISPEDFRVYFYVDGIPPLVPFSYFWLYTSLGRPDAGLPAIYVLVQYCVLAYFCFKLAETLSGKEAARWSLVAVAACPMLFWAVLMGQETGSTAISCTAMLYFIVSAKGADDWRSMVMAGLSAALGCLSREYGGALVVCGVFACFLKRQSWQDIFLFTMAALLPSAPWYIRNWAVAGNPFYSNPVGRLFTVNMVHTQILEQYVEEFGFTDTGSRLLPELLRIALVMFPVQLLLGVGGVLHGRRRLAALGGSCLVVGWLWLYSVGRTSGGLFYSCRVLSPVLALLSVAAGIALAEGKRGRFQSSLRAATVVLCVLGCCQSSIMPGSIWRDPVGSWSELAFGPVLHPAENAASYCESLPKGSRILSGNAYFHAALVETELDVVPVWSPEVAFLFDPQLDAAEAAERLRVLGIDYVLFDPGAVNNIYLERYAFFRAYLRAANPLFSVPGGILFEL
ncbi:MAG: hypothetical protein HN742_24740 [Lentisphaerae bacterium]|mgnify:FL=1|jgi:hypothetical protein|nr:hypothetical protein [Lentisphaerota bacterium]MBT4816085.1 hypothetical protein [Lentisphaerota bacterium]MBT5606242.1 hypothetical protein [Lentisphaerota bacterium]MBT7054069.1 hypothetical protein [Lentisphaerota bacterium]MBT7845108.1 hypothetical protein [Lentisphaerota bacterium]